MEKISKVLSVAIRQTLRDLDLCVNDPKYIINFNDWHDKEFVIIGEISQFVENIVEEKCSVCFAGSSMAKSIGAKHGIRVTPESYPEHTNMLYALDHIRYGAVEAALSELELEVPEGMSTDYDVDQSDYTAFVETVNQIANDLEKHGL